MNAVSLVGRLTREPDLRFAPTTGKAIARFSLAVNRPGKDKGTDFINCVAFGKSAETIATYIQKGRQVAISGTIRTGSYEKDGQKYYNTDIWVSGFTFIGNNSSNDNTPTAGGFNDNGMEEVPDDGDIPF